ncbi:MAG: TAT-variant-translocated molybdopterin oxidoreductase [Flavobacteriales bacterium]|nr:TAT-variant-translocated molybdopterin oxidoreductase [Flavobacteriales bacterium]
MSNNKKYWKGVEELNETPSFQESKNKEFSELIPVEDFLGDANLLENSQTTRRDFLKYLGFGVTAASLAACETPVNKVIPYVVKTDKTSPGVANYFATSYFDGNDYCDILVKTREGRPIKIEGNKMSPLTKGGVNARINSSVLSLYDGNRFKSPMIDGSAVSWTTFNDSIKKELSAILSKGGKVRLLTNTIHSPSTLRLIAEFKSNYPEADIKQVTYDAISYSGMLEANLESFGKAVLPSYNLSKAKSIVSIGADFMSSFPSSIELTHQYASGRKPENGWMSKHFQFESSMSLTGSNADVRVPVKTSLHGAVVANLYNYIAKKVGASSVSAANIEIQERIEKAGEHLLANKGASIVLSGSNDKSIQVLVNGINDMLGNYGSTIDIANHSNERKGIDGEVSSLVKEMSAGSVDALMMVGVNPSLTMPSSINFNEALGKVKLAISFASRPNETTTNTKYIAATPNYLESWGDANPKTGYYALIQPTINPLFDTKQFEDCLLSWMDKSESYYDYIRATWESTLFANQTESVFFGDFWNKKLHDGLYISKPEVLEPIVFAGNVSSAASQASKIVSSDWEIEFYEKVGIGSGNQASNPWLQELPDPISKITWDNYLVMNPSDARENGFATEYGEQKNADTVNLTVNGYSFENIPVIAQPGQTKGTLGVALGYGQAIGKKNEVIGFNAYPAMAMNNGSIAKYSTDVSFVATGEDYQIATTQTHHTVMGRTSVVRETNLDTFKNGSKDDYNPAHILSTGDGPKDVSEIDLWAEHPVKKVGHHWGMSIDLNACIGCGSCVTSCNSENNVPVVGKDEVRRSREMHWMRIDRYFSSNPEDVEQRNYTSMETPEENPQVVHQPMMCQHCNHAPCETVCPVAATTHSDEGINQMTYNRCIGTRYCANNCPYKVRRFNWFSYQNLNRFEALNPSQDDLGRMVLNPDVTVRARGVMEKCSLCVQIIQTGKLEAKKEGRKVIDGEIETACASACPTHAITFGDLNDESSLVRKASESNRSYRVIEEIGTQPNIYYQVKVRNTETNIA